MLLKTEITPELKLKGQAREIVRAIREIRKIIDFEVDNRINTNYVDADKVFTKFRNLIAKEVLANKMGDRKAS